MNNNNTPLIGNIWRRWLLCSTGAALAMGLAFTLAPYQMQSLFHIVYYSEPFSPRPGEEISFSPAAIQHMAFTYAVLGAVMVGWASTLFSIVLTFLPLDEKKAWIAIAVSVGIWFTLDTILSLLLGFSANAVLNLGFFIAFVIPLAATARRVLARRNPS